MYGRAKVVNGFAQGRLRQRTLTRLLPVVDGLIVQARSRRMMRQDLERHLVTGFKGIKQCRVNLLALALQQTLIGRVAHQRVFESVARIGQEPTLEYQLGLDELRQRRLQFLCIEPRDGNQQAIVELTSDTGRHLRHLTNRL